MLIWNCFSFRGQAPWSPLRKRSTFYMLKRLKLLIWQLTTFRVMHMIITKYKIDSKPITFAVKKLDMKNSVNEYEIRNPPHLPTGKVFKLKNWWRGIFFKIFEECTPLFAIMVIKLELIWLLSKLDKIRPKPDLTCHDIVTVTEENMNTLTKFKNTWVDESSSRWDTVAYSLFAK